MLGSVLGCGSRCHQPWLLDAEASWRCPGRTLRFYLLNLERGLDPAFSDVPRPTAPSFTFCVVSTSDAGVTVSFHPRGGQLHVPCTQVFGASWSSAEPFMYFLVALPAQQCSGRNRVGAESLAAGVDVSHPGLCDRGVLLPTQKQSWVPGTKYMSVFIPLRQSLSPPLFRAWERLALSQ